MEGMFFRSLIAWFVIIVIETIHGIARRLLLVPIVGESDSNRIGVFIGSALILMVVWFLYGWLKVFSRPAQLFVGLLWCSLTFCFEVGLGFGLGYSLDQMLVGYNPNQGGLMLFGMAIMLFSLIIVSKFRAT
ncbi:MAG: hypothetical protein Kow0060_19530 [Methylohalobius crimeensis]